MDLIVSKKTIKKTKTEHQKAGKIIQNQKYLKKGKLFSVNNKARDWPSEMAYARQEEKVRRIFLARY